MVLTVLVWVNDPHVGMNCSGPGPLLMPPPTPSSKYSSRFYHPYFTHKEVELLSEKQRGKQTATQEEKVRQSASTFIENVAARVGL